MRESVHPGLVALTFLPGLGLLLWGTLAPAFGTDFDPIPLILGAVLQTFTFMGWTSKMSHEQ